MVMQVVVVMREFLLNAYDNSICASTNWLKTEISEFIFKTVEEDVYLIEDSDVKEIEEVKTLKLSRELI